jgi:hypothetical protein
MSLAAGKKRSSDLLSPTLRFEHFFQSGVSEAAAVDHAALLFLCRRERNRSLSHRVPMESPVLAGDARITNRRIEGC